MEAKKKVLLKVEALVNAPVESVWNCWTGPEHIVKWNSASDDWHTTRADNDLREGGKFSSRMEAKDGSMGFDFWGIHKKIDKNKQIISELGDGRSLKVIFTTRDGKTLVSESFEAEGSHPPEMQQKGWQAILDNFKKYVEGLEK